MSAALKRGGLALFALLLAGTVAAQQTITLDSVGIANLPGDSIEIQLTFDATPPEPSGFMLDDPARISLDLAGVTSGLSQRRFDIDSNNAQSLVVLDDGSRTRLVVNLDHLVDYETRSAGNMLTVLVGNGAAAGVATPGQTFSDISDINTAGAGVTTPGQTFSDISDIPDGSGNQITGVDFRRGAGEEGQVVIEFSNDQVVGSVEQAGSRLYVEFGDTAVPDDLNRRFDVSDFATGVTAVDVLGRDGRATVIIDIDGAYEYIAFRSSNQYTVSVRPPAPDTAVDEAAARYTGEVTDLAFQDIPVRSVLQILADYHDFNLIATDAVSGNITIQMDNVPWDQALELVLRTRNLGSRLEGNVLYVAPADEIAAQEQAELEALAQAQTLAPLVTEFVQVNYADAGKIRTLLIGEGGGDGDSGAIGAEGSGPPPEPGGNSGILSPRGTAAVDERTNIIIVRDIEEKLEEVRALVARLDVAVRQVLIEARIVNVSTDFGRDLGVRWGGQSTGDNFRYGGSLESSLHEASNQRARQTALQEAVVAGEAARIEALRDGTDPGLINSLVQQAIASVPIPMGDVLFPDALVVDLGVRSSGAGSFSIGYSGNDGLIELELSALESSGNGEVIARPKVTTQDKVTAEIRSGVRIPYQSQAGGTAGGSTTEFEDAVLSLRVTPQITPDGRINMDLEIQQDQVAPRSGSVPAINTNEVITSALVNNGETIVLGGVFREENTTLETKTPVLGDLPYLGRLFKHSSSETRRTELLIFITPKIIADINI